MRGRKVISHDVRVVNPHGLHVHQDPFEHLVVAWSCDCGEYAEYPHAVPDARVLHDGSRLRWALDAYRAHMRTTR